MKAFLAKYRIKIIIALTVIFTLINLANLIFVVDIAPISNDECLWRYKTVDKDSTIVVFSKVKFEGVTWNAGIRDGDRLISINDNEVKDIFEAQLLLNRAEKGDSADYLVSRNGEEFLTKVLIKKLINFQALAYVLLSFIWVLVGFIVILAKPEGSVQRLFYAIGGLFTLTSVSNFFLVGFSQNPYFYVKNMLIITDLLWITGASFLPFVLVRFFWIFPREFKIIKYKYTVKILTYSPIILLIIAIALRWTFIYVNPIELFNMPFFLRALFFGIFSLLNFIALIIGFVSLLINYLRLKSASERTAIFIILLSYGIGLAAIIYTSTLANVLADSIFNSPEYFMPIIVVAFLPVAFAYSIFRYSLMDVTDVIKTSVYYFTATISIAGTYFLVIYLLGQNISEALSTEYQGIIASIIFIFFAIVFQSTKDKFQNMLTKRFYPEQFASQNMLLKFSKDISSIVGLENILNETMHTIVDALEIRHFAILVKDDSSGNFVLRRGVGTKSDDFVIDNREMRIKKFISNKLDLSLPPVIERHELETVFKDEVELLIKEEIYTVIPLQVKTKIIGLLLFGLKHSGAQFAGKDLELLIASANQVAVAIENARLYESETEKKKMERDIENAREIQESLLPKVLPEINSLSVCGTMIPAMQIGGDYYDVIKISDTRVFIIIADVSGKGLAASFYMSKIQTMMRLFCNSDKTPKQILKEVNAKIFESIQKNWFITLSIGLFDTDEKKLYFCRAGHTPLLQLSESKVSIITPKGIGIGLEKGDIFDEILEEIVIDLKDETLFAFYSDGITEDMDIKREMFGLNRLSSLLVKYKDDSDCKIIMNSIIAEIKTFRGAMQQSDDITLVLVKYSE